MSPFVKNIFDIPLPRNQNEEVVETIIVHKNILIERIISTGQKTPSGEWYDQQKDEWVMLLQGSAVLSFEDEIAVTMNRGDYLFIPAHTKHRVVEGQNDPPCIWLAVHADLSSNSE